MAFSLFITQRLYIFRRLAIQCTIQMDYVAFIMATFCPFSSLTVLGHYEIFLDGIQILHSGFNDEVQGEFSFLSELFL